MFKIHFVLSYVYCIGNLHPLKIMSRYQKHLCFHLKDISNLINFVHVYIKTCLGFNYVWRLQKIDKCILQTVKQRICDQEKQLILSKLQEMTKCRIYKHLIDGASIFTISSKEGYSKEVYEIFDKMQMIISFTSSRNWTIS